MSTTDSEPGIPRLYTLREAAEAARCSYHHLLRHVHDGTLPTVHPGGGTRFYVTEDDLRDYLTTATTREGVS